MTTPVDRWLLDTNVWIFGLRRDHALPACTKLLERIGSFVVTIPLQVLKELNFNLTEDEMRDFYQLLNSYPDFIELSWELADIDRVRFFEERGCRKGGRSHRGAEALRVTVIVSENRQFLRTIDAIPLPIMTATEAIERLGSA